MTSKQLSVRLDNVQRTFDYNRGLRDSIQKKLVEQQNKKQQAEQLQTLYHECAGVYQQLSTMLYSRVVKKIEEVVTQIYQFVFEIDAKFLINCEIKRSVQTAEFALMKKGRMCSILDDEGGGTVDVVSFALRVVILLLSKQQRLIIMDEPFKHLSVNYRHKIPALLEWLTTTYDIQIIMTTHADELVAGKVHRIGG